MSQYIRIYADKFEKDATNKTIVTWDESIEAFKETLYKYSAIKADTAEVYTKKPYIATDYCTVTATSYSDGNQLGYNTNNNGMGGEIPGYTPINHEVWLNMTDLIDGTINKPKLVCTKYGGYGTYETPKPFINVLVTYKKPTINNITFTRTEDGYKATIDAYNWDSYTVNIYKRDEYNAESLNYTFEGTLQEFIVITSKLTEGLDRNRIEVIMKHGDATTSYSKVLSYYVPSISNLKVENENSLIDNVTNITWTSKNQGKAEIYCNDILIKTISGSITLAVLPKGVLKVGKNKVTVRVYSPVITGVLGGQVAVQTEATITLNRILPTVKNLTINDTNTDHVITATWESTNQTRFSIVQGTKNIISGENANSVAILAGKIDVGNTGLKIIVYYDSGFDTIQAELSIEATFTKNTPIIYNLEPSNLNINVDEIINVTFATNEFCDRWELFAAGLLTKGTQERSVNFGKEVFKQGSNEMTLKIYYSPAHNPNEVRTAIKKVNFNGYGTPRTPIFDGNVLYSTATPKLTWEAIDQVEIHLLIIEAETEDVIQEKLEFISDKFVVLEALEDNRAYIVHLSIKNKYGLWSEYAQKEFQTKFNDIILPTFDLFEAETSVYLTVGGIQDPNFKSISVYRKSEREDMWTEIANDCNIEDTIRDFTCPANLEIFYKLRVYDKNNAYKDTEIKTISISLSSYILTNLENAEDIYTIFGTPSYKFNSDFVSKLYAGQKAPRTFKSNVQYKTGTFRTTLKNVEAYKLIDFIENSNKYNLFCLRDQRGEKLYVIVKLESQDPKGLNRLSISFNFTEVNFIESKMYTGSGYKKIVYLNGEYYLDGSIDLSGYDINITID